MLESASLTSSSLKGLMIASTFFILIAQPSRQEPWAPATRPLLPFPYIPALTQALSVRGSSSFRLLADFEPLLFASDQPANVLVMPKQHQRGHHDREQQIWPRQRKRGDRRHQYDGRYDRRE